MNNFIPQLIELFQPAFILLAEGALAIMVPMLLWKLNSWAKAKVHDSRFHCAMDKLTSHAETAVLDVGQTYVKEVKRSGKWGAEPAAAAKEKAKGRFALLLGPAGLKELKSCLGQDEDGLKALIESALETALVKAKDRWLKPKHPPQLPGASEK